MQERIPSFPSEKWSQVKEEGEGEGVNRCCMHVKRGVVCVCVCLFRACSQYGEGICL